MKTSALVLACASLVAFVSPSSARGLFDLLVGKNDLETFTVTDVSAEGRQRRQPTRENPVYYVAVSGGYRDLGGYWAGERPISRDQMNSTVLKALAKQGYLPAPAGQAPEIIIFWKWGTLNTVLIPSPITPISSSFTVQVNEMAIRRFLGGSKLGLVSGDPSSLQQDLLSPGLMFASGNASALLNAAREDLYITSITAYDCKVSPQGKPVVLWNTRIGAPSRGLTMPTALPAMVAIATPFIGRETDKPMWIKATDHYRPDIRIGDPTVVAYLEQSLPAVANLGRND